MLSEGSKERRCLAWVLIKNETDGQNRLHCMKSVAKREAFQIKPWEDLWEVREGQEKWMLEAPRALAAHWGEASLARACRQALNSWVH